MLMTATVTGWNPVAVAVNGQLTSFLSRTRNRPSPSVSAVSLNSLGISRYTRSAAPGSVRAACRAGIHAAIHPSPRNIVAMLTIVNGSAGWT